MGAFFDKNFWWLPFGSEPDVTVHELSAMIAKTRGRPNLLDVRTRPEWLSGAIRGSMLLPVNQIASHVDSFGLDKSKPVIAICRSASRSLTAVRLLRNAGFTDVRHLRGGMIAWQGANFPIVYPADD